MANNNLCFTLAFNLVSETQKAVENLYRQNDQCDFYHVITDCGFPLLEGDKIPEDIEEAKELNTIALKALAEKYGSGYVKIKNEGVSQNWTRMWEYFNPDDNDTMIGVEPDEIPIESGWIKCLGEVLRGDDDMGYAAPTLIDNKEVLKRSGYAKPKIVAGHNVLVMLGSVNYGILGIKGSLINKMGGIAEYHLTPIYGNIESVLLAAIKKYNMQWCILQDYYQIHTNVPILLRQWKNEIIFNVKERGQYSFEKWLSMKKNNEI